MRQMGEWVKSGKDKDGIRLERNVATGDQRLVVVSTGQVLPIELPREEVVTTRGRYQRPPRSHAEVMATYAAVLMILLLALIWTARYTR